jgi:hypothetical protein
MSKSFFNHSLVVDNSTKHLSRSEFLINAATGLKVLHVGFVDFPITNLANNLHLKLSSVCTRLDGIDPNADEEIKKILSVSNGTIYNSWNEIPNDYDLILIPEVIEHVDNVRDFLETVGKYNGKLIITAPCAHLLSNNFCESETGFVEVVHKDHNCWYSPYTLKNVITKYCKTKTVNKLQWVEGSIVAICE